MLNKSLQMSVCEFFKLKTIGQLTALIHNKFSVQAIMKRFAAAPLNLDKYMGLPAQATLIQSMNSEHLPLVHEGQIFKNSLKEELDALVISQHRVLGTFNLYNVKTNTAGTRYFDIHILVTSMLEDTEARLAFERLQQWHQKYLGQSHYVTQGQQARTLYGATISSKQKQQVRKDGKNDKDTKQKLDKKTKASLIE